MEPYRFSKSDSELDTEPVEFIDLSEPHVTRETIQEIIGMRPKVLEYYQKALVHKSVQKHVKINLSHGLEVQEYMKESFERLEFLGDSVLNFIVAEMLYNMYPKEDEGFLTRLRTKIVRGTTCCNLAKKLKLGPHILAGSKMVGVKDSDGSVINERILEDTLESIIGAIYLDLGIDCARSFINKLIKANVNIHELSQVDDNFKDILMRYSQINYYELPMYKLISTEGPSHNKTFRVHMFLRKSTEPKIDSNWILYGIGTGATKKEAEQNACKDSICNNTKSSCRVCIGGISGTSKIHYDEIENVIKRTT